MARIKFKDYQNMGKEERNKKLIEVKLELVKARAEASKGGSSKIREAKKTIARLLTINKSVKEELKTKK